MLTLILLVVLGGGAGLLAVSLSDHRAPWAALLGRRGAASLRPSPAQDTSPAIDDTELWIRPPDEPPRRYQRVGATPKDRTAIEGPYDEVALAPWWRRLVSLVLIVVVLTVLGAGIALVLGAVFAAIGALLDGAIG